MRTGRCTRRSATRATRTCFSAAASTPASCATSSPRSSRTSSSSSTSRSSISRRGRRGRPRRSSAARCPDGILVPPAEFVPHVERTPLVRELTFLVVADALDSAQQWARRRARPRCRDQHPVPPPRRPAVRGRPRGDAPHDRSDQSAGDSGSRSLRPGGGHAGRRGDPRLASTRSASVSHSTTPVAPRRSPRCACSPSTSSRSTSASSTASAGARRTRRSSAG